MIPKKHIDAYKSIKAPETLHDRVTASADSAAGRTRKFPRLLTAAASIAASIAIVTVAVIVLRTGSVDTDAYLAYNGQPVESSVAITINHTSSIKPLEIGMPNSGGIKLEVHTAGKTTVTVSDGSVTLVDKNGTATDTGDLLTISDNRNHIIHWQADFYKVSESEPFTLVIANAHGSVTYTLNCYDGEFMLTKTSKTD